MAAKRFSEFTPIPLGQKMKVVGLFGVENTISEEQVYLLSQEEFVQVQEDAAKALLDSADAVTKADAATAKNLLQDQSLEDLSQGLVAVNEKVDALPEVPVRKKTEVIYLGLNQLLTANTNYNLVTLLKALVATSGTLAPFFNTASDKMNVYAEDSSVLFKLSLSGAWTGNQTSNRSIQLDFVGTNGNRLTKSRDESVTTDVITLVSFFSVDAAGFLVNNGTAPILRSNGNNFTISEVTLIAEQVTTQTSISEK